MAEQKLIFSLNGPIWLRKCKPNFNEIYMPHHYRIQVWT